MRLDSYLASVRLDLTGFHRGGNLVLPAETAPAGQLLKAPCDCVSISSSLPSCVKLGGRGLGDSLLALSIPEALNRLSNPSIDLSYKGRWPNLHARCSLPFKDLSQASEDYIYTDDSSGLVYAAVPEAPPAYLLQEDGGRVQVAAALPLRYLHQFGLPPPENNSDLLPHFRGRLPQDALEVLLIDATSRPDRKSWGSSRYKELANRLRRAKSGLKIRILPGNNACPCDYEDSCFDDVLSGSLEELIDFMGRSAAVIGNDTGLVHLAAMCRDTNGKSPQVIGLYARHSFLKWTTGLPNHHALFTRFSLLMALGDKCPVRDSIEDSAWLRAASLEAIKVDEVLEAALKCLA